MCKCHLARDQIVTFASLNISSGVSANGDNTYRKNVDNAGSLEFRLPNTSLSDLFDSEVQLELTRVICADWEVENWWAKYCWGKLQDFLASLK